MQPTLPISSPPPSRGSRRTGVVAAALFVLLAGVAGGVVLILLSGNRVADGVKGLARAPIGCATTLDFTSTGTFIVYVETKGTVGELRGDCPNAERSYEYDGGDVPDVKVLLVDGDGAELELDRDRSKSYDDSGFRGESIATVNIADPGSYVLTASSDEAEVAVTVGKDPTAGADSLRVGGYIAIAAGVLVGLVMLLIGMRRSAPTPPAGVPTVAPPGAPYDVYTPTMPPNVAPPTVAPPTMMPPPPPPPTQVMPPQPPGQWPSPPSA